MRTISKLMGCALSLLLLPAAAQGASIFTSVLTGPGEAPPNASPGICFATVTLDPVLHKLTLDVTFSGLIGVTTASHIHASTVSPFAGTAIVATTTPNFPGFPLSVSSGSYLQTFDMTLTSSYNPAFLTANANSVSVAETALFNAIASGNAYLNIHSNTFPSGEIRGFFTPAVPLPPAALSGGLTLGSLVLLKLRRRA